MTRDTGWVPLCKCGCSVRKYQIWYSIHGGSHCQDVTTVVPHSCLMTKSSEHHHMIMSVQYSKRGDRQVDQLMWLRVEEGLKHRCKKIVIFYVSQFFCESYLVFFSCENVILCWCDLSIDRNHDWSSPASQPRCMRPSGTDCKEKREESLYSYTAWGESIVCGTALTPFTSTNPSTCYLQHPMFGEMRRGCERTQNPDQKGILLLEKRGEKFSHKEIFRNKRELLE